MSRNDRQSALVAPGLPSEEGINARYGPTFSGYAQALSEALEKLRED